MPEEFFFSINKPKYLCKKDLIDVALEHRNSKILVALNSDKLILNNKNQNFINLCNANICYLDGVGAAWAHNRKYKSNAKKIAGVELYLDILQELATKNVPIAIIGGSEKMINQSSIVLKDQIQNLQIAGISEGYIDKSSWDTTILKFKEAGAGYIIAAMGSPRQEEFLMRSLNIAGIGGMGVGGSLKVLVGEQQRAPKLFRDNGLEFLYRYIWNGVKFHRIRADFIFFLKTLTRQY